MAELYRRVFRLSHSGRRVAGAFPSAFAPVAYGLAALVAVASGGSLARAQEVGDRSHAQGAIEVSVRASVVGADHAREGQKIDADRIATLERQLASDDAREREAAFALLSHLPERSLSAIASWVAESRRPYLDTERSYEAVRKFRHSMGSRRADDMEDIVPGVLPWLAEHRDTITVRMAARLALLRSLEAIGGVAAFRVVNDLFSIDFEPWRFEAQRVVHRHGAQILPSLLEARFSDSPGVRRWARRAIRDLRLGDAGDAVQRLKDDPRTLGELLLAYATVKEFEAMPVVVSYVDAPDEGVRRASRQAMESFGSNGIWMLRRAHRNLLGDDAESSWGWKATMDKLYAALDARRDAPMQRRLERALEVFAQGDHAEAHRLYDALLLDAPNLARRSDLAAGYGAFADQARERGDRAEAMALYRRAIGLAAGDVDPSWRARLEALKSLERIDAGIIDLPGLRAAGAQIENDDALEAALSKYEPADVSSGPWTVVALACVLLGLVLLGYGWIRAALSRLRIPPQLGVTIARALARARRQSGWQRSATLDARFFDRLRELGSRLVVRGSSRAESTLRAGRLRLGSAHLLRSGMTGHSFARSAKKWWADFVRLFDEGASSGGAPSTRPSQQERAKPRVEGTPHWLEQALQAPGKTERAHRLSSVVAQQGAKAKPEDAVMPQYLRASLDANDTLRD